MRCLSPVTRKSIFLSLLRSLSRSLSITLHRFAPTLSRFGMKRSSYRGSAKKEKEKERQATKERKENYRRNGPDGNSNCERFITDIAAILSHDLPCNPLSFSTLLRVFLHEAKFVYKHPYIHRPTDRLLIYRSWAGLWMMGRTHSGNQSSRVSLKVTCQG